MSPHFSTLLAYIDPGTGSLILQTMIAAIVGVFVFFRTALWRMLGWFKRSSNPGKNDTAKKELESEANRS